MARKKQGNKRGIDKMKNRMGLSTIIVTLIIILLSLVAIGILWTVVRNLLQNQAEVTTLQNNFFSEQMNIVDVNYNEPFMNITLKRPAGEIKISDINITTTSNPSPMPADIFSAVDLSGSMRECYNITSAQCSSMLGSYGIPSACNLLSTTKQAACTAYGGARWYGQCANISSSQCDNLGGSTISISSSCEFVSTTRQATCLSYGGIWYGECTNISSSQCSTLGGSYNLSTCDTIQSNYSTACTNYGGIANDKLSAAQDANRNLITSLLASGNNRIGLIGYKDVVSNTGSTNLITDFNSLNNTINSWQAGSGTCLCCGINNASAKLMLQSSPEKLKIMIIMTDGQANTVCSQQGTGDAKKDAIKAACTANASLSNLVIYSVGVIGADADTLTNISNCGGGKYYSVANIIDLIGVYQTIAQQIQGKSQSITSLSYLSVIFYNATDSYKTNIDEQDMPDVLQLKTYSFNLAGYLSGTIIRIEIYPVVVSNKQEIVGPIMGYWGQK